METRSEVERLLDVYRGYATRGFGESKWSPDNRGNQTIMEECHARLQQLLHKTGFFPLENRRLLEVGCGTGDHLGAFLKMGARAQNLSGIDLIPDRIHAAREKYPQVSFEVGNAEALPFNNGSFELVAVFTVFTSVLDRQMAANMCSEINRVLVAGGAVIWYDFRLNNPINHHVRGIRRREIQELFPGFAMNVETISLLPPLARRLGRLTGTLYPLLRTFPFLRSHCLGVLTKPKQSVE